MSRFLDITQMEKIVNNIKLQQNGINVYINIDNTSELFNNTIPKLYKNMPMIRTKMINTHKTYSIDALNTQFIKSVNEFIDYCLINEANVRNIYVISDDPNISNKFNKSLNINFIHSNKLNNYIDTNIALLIIDTKINNIVHDNVHYTIIKYL